ncbi:50S ribosomal protein L2 [Candidatus Woesearchaeota archaeon]|nr:50S ribosomal protein L2 [Candidatus Woesearchaeota archaeon]
MGKNLITQKRGKGSFTYRAHSHRWKGEISHKVYDDAEKKKLVKGIITDLIHCGGHNAPLAEIKYENGESVLIAAPMNIKLNEPIESGVEAAVKEGNTLPLKSIPEGTSICNIESQPGKNAFCRAAGSFGKVLNKFEDHVVIELPSKKQKSLNPNCRATIGIIAGAGKKDKPFVKAGKKHWATKSKGKLYPRTSGVAMNAVDHPFGSGRGRHIGKPKTAPRFASPGRNVGLIHARKTGRAKKQ